jgi:hypothetical protein
VTTFVTRVAASPQAARRRMTIRTEDSRVTITVPFAPKVIQYTELAQRWVEIDRPGRPPILSSSSKPLPRLSYDLFVGGTDPEESQEWRLQTLKALAEGRDRVVVSFGPAEGGLWRITSLSTSSIDRHPVTGERTRATVSIELTQASDSVLQAGPVSGGASSSGGPTKAQWHTIKAGDTLHRLAVKYYGDPRKWRLVADANGIRRPKPKRNLVGTAVDPDNPGPAKLRVGSKIKIPAQ